MSGSCAILTAVYPAAQPYLDDFVASLLAQDDQDFILYVLDDARGDATHRFGAFTGRMRVIPALGNPVAIRKQGISALHADGIHEVIFADCDDCFSTNRVSWSRTMLTQCDVVVNELVAFSAFADQIPMLSPLLKEGEEITWGQILHGNVLGLSNTAARVAAIHEQAALVEDGLTVFDWALFSRVLHQRARARFTALTTTFYRQHAGNIAGYQGMDAKTLLHCIKVKAAHYAALTDVDPVYEDLAQRFKALDEELADDPSQLARYGAQMARQIQSPPQARGVWWSGARVPTGSIP